MDLFSLIPSINRARGYRLYSQNGDRFLDFYQEGGAAVMGHRQKGLSLELKNTVDKGSFSPFASKYKGNFIKALKTVFGSSYHIYIFSNIDRAVSKLKEKNLEFSIRKVFDSGVDASQIFIPLLPFPGNFAPAAVLSCSELALEEDPISPLLLAGAARVVWNLKDFMEKADYSCWTVPSFTENASKIWKIDVPYLYPVISEDKYETVFKIFLKGNIILSPFFTVPSVLPMEISEGELKKTVDKCRMCAEVL